jgi:hypothetical protein
VYTAANATRDFFIEVITKSNPVRLTADRLGSPRRLPHLHSPQRREIETKVASQLGAAGGARVSSQRRML